jgi:hypothetical protein
VGHPATKVGDVLGAGDDRGAKRCPLGKLERQLQQSGHGNQAASEVLDDESAGDRGAEDRRPPDRSWRIARIKTGCDEARSDVAGENGEDHDGDSQKPGPNPVGSPARELGAGGGQIFPSITKVLSAVRPPGTAGFRA